MPSASQHPAREAVTLLLVGDSKAGKTGALASLANAGYELFVLDLDNGLDVLVRALKPEAKVFYQTLVNPYKMVGNAITLEGRPHAFQKAMRLLDRWVEDDGRDFGPFWEWDSNRILVIDSLSFLARAAYEHSKVFNPSKDGRQIYFTAQDATVHVLNLIHSKPRKCHIIMTAHIDYQEDSTSVLRAFPSTIGKALGPSVPKYFNAMLKVESMRGERKIVTKSNAYIELGTGTTVKIPDSLPQETGLKTFFELVLGGATKPKPKTETQLNLNLTQSKG